MTCKCGHLIQDHAKNEDKVNECFKCDCLKFVDSNKTMNKVSEACEWNSCEFCESLECQCVCHEISRKNTESYGN